MLTGRMFLLLLMRPLLPTRWLSGWRVRKAPHHTTEIERGTVIHSISNEKLSLYKERIRGGRNMISKAITICVDKLKMLNNNKFVNSLLFVILSIKIQNLVDNIG